MMSAERRLCMSEDVPLNSGGAPRIILNTGNLSNKQFSRDGTVIQLSSGGAGKAADLGVHINTTLSMATSKKMKLLIILNILLSVICMVISLSVAYFYWNEMTTMRKNMDILKDQFMLQSVGRDMIQTSPLVYQRPLQDSEAVHPKQEAFTKENMPHSQQRNNNGQDMPLISLDKNNQPNKDSPLHNLPFTNKELLVIHFNGAIRETNMGSQSIIGPWLRDTDISSPNSENKIELNANYVTIQEGGLYLIYSQIVYLTQAPNCYFVWARQTGQSPRLLSTCATGDDSSRRPLDKSQISCSTQTVARLYKNDIVNIAQREQNRTLWLRPGYSYFGFIKLSS